MQLDKSRDDDSKNQNISLLLYVTYISMHKLICVFVLKRVSVSCNVRNVDAKHWEGLKLLAEYTFSALGCWAGYP